MKKAQKIRRIAFGIFGVAVLMIIIIILVKHKKSQNDDNIEENEEDELEYNEEKSEKHSIEKLDNSDDELFKRVNKAKFKALIEEDSQTDNNVNADLDTVKSEEENREIVEEYFRSLDTKRKGKHF